ncbi:MAG: acyltransferase [Planctomycetota bacterium]
MVGSSGRRDGTLAAWLRARFEIAPAAPHRFPAMEGLRGFAVLLVFLVHYASLGEPWLACASATASSAAVLHDVGGAGVDLFFLLSGYLIYGMLMQRRQSFTAFMARRVQRIYPTFLVVFAIYLALAWSMPSSGKLPAGWAPAALLVLENLLLLPGLFAVRPIISVAWSLSYEMFSYVTIPVLIGALQLRGWGRARRVVLLVALALAMFASAPLLGSHLRLVMFVAGMLLHELCAAPACIRERGLGLAALALGLATLCLLSWLAIATPLRQAALFASFLVLCRASLHGLGPTRTAFSWTPLRWLGNMSYSYYLIHGLTLKAALLIAAKLHPPAAGDTWLFWIALPFFLAVTLLAGAVLFVLVERPWSLAGSGARGRRVARVLPERAPIDLVQSS